MMSSITPAKLALAIFIIAFLTLLLFGNGKIGHGKVGLLREQPTPQIPQNFIVLCTEYLPEYNMHILTVKDKETNDQYLIVRDKRGLSIAPRLITKE